MRMRQGFRSSTALLHEVNPAIFFGCLRGRKDVQRTWTRKRCRKNPERSRGWFRSRRIQIKTAFGAGAFGHGRYFYAIVRIEFKRREDRTSESSEIGGARTVF